MISHIRVDCNRVVIKHTMFGRRTQEALLNRVHLVSSYNLIILDEAFVVQITPLG
jgi:hypothetical protein